MDDSTESRDAPGLEESARQLARQLAETRTRLVLAESCTGGLAAATLAAIPGISQWLCGSAVTYREQSKIDWLGVSAADIARVTAVSAEVARAMAWGVLLRTSEADLAVSVTGHLGPDAPAAYDGLVWLGVARRHAGWIESPSAVRHILTNTLRVQRQREAATLVLRQAGREVPRS